MTFTKDQYSTPEALEKILKGEMGFPYKKYSMTEEEVRERFTRLSSYEPTFDSFPYIIYNNPDLPKTWLLYGGDYKLIHCEYSSGLYENISDYFQEEARAECKRFDSKYSYVGFWKTHGKEILEYCVKTYGDEINAYTLRKSLYRLNFGCTLYPPSWTVALIKLFKARTVLDMCAGWGDRLVGAMSQDLDLYVGVDPNSKLHPNYEKMIRFFNKSTDHYKLINSAFETADIPTPSKKFDLLVASPPYFTAEEYSDEKSQSIYNRSFEEWYNDFLLVSVRKAKDLLALDGHFALSMYDIKGIPNYTERIMVDINKSPDMIFLGCISAGYDGVSRMTPRPFWIWKKANLPTIENYNPEIIIDEVSHQGKKFKVVRDDYLLAGTKQRGLVKAFGEFKEEEIVHGISNTSLAQITIALAAKIHQKKATIFLPNIRPLTKQTLLTIRLGANIIENDPPNKLPELRECALKYAEKNHAKFLEAGLADDFFKQCLKENILKALPKSIKPEAEHIFWLVADSGTLLSTLYTVFPNSKFNVVQLGSSIDKLVDISNTTIYKAEEGFWEPAKIFPPYPSASAYDAKLWRFVEKYGKDGDIIWNAAKDPEL